MKKYKICKAILVILAVFLCVVFYELLGICIAYKKQPEVSDTTRKETKNESWNERSENTELKSATEPTLQAVTALLGRYPEVFDPAVNPEAVRIAVTGRVPVIFLQLQTKIVRRELIIINYYDPV